MTTATSTTAAPVPLVERTAETPLGTLGYWEGGGGDGGGDAVADCEVLLVHGAFGRRHQWWRNAATLARGVRRLVAVDLPGFGESYAPVFGESPSLDPLAEGLGELRGMSIKLMNDDDDTI